MAALSHNPSEAFEGHNVLREIPSAFGVVLWQVIRDVTLWANVERRNRLFAQGAGGLRQFLLAAAAGDVPEELEAALGVLTGLASFPHEANEEALSMACGRIARWAEGENLTATALSFAQAASLALPHRSAPAYEAGRIASMRGERARAEVWLRRAIGLARHDNDGVAGAFAYAELGDLHLAAGEHEEARELYAKTMRLARRKSVYMARGRAFYGLGELERRAGRDVEAERLLRAARRPLGKSHPLRLRVIFGLADIAIRQGRAAEMVELLTQLRVTTDAVAERLRLEALLTMCAAQMGHVSHVARLWSEAYALADRVPPSEDRAYALLDLARAASLARNRAWAHMAASRALATAEHMGAATIAAEAIRVRDAAYRSTGGASESEG